MTEYMSREDYCEESCGKENRNGYKTCHNCGMLNVPSVDVQPVKRGEWGKRAYGRLQCSYCGKCEDVATDFCPNCGARMDGEING